MAKLLRLVGVLVLAAVAVSTIASCGSGSTVTDTPTEAQPKLQTHLYASLWQQYQGGPGGVAMFSLPITNASKPVATITASDGPWGLALDAAGRLYSAPGWPNSQVDVYAHPLAGPANPDFVANVPGEFLAFDSSGDLYDGYSLAGAVCRVVGVTKIFFITPFISIVYPPITGSSIPNVNITEPTDCGGPSVVGLAVDHGGNLWAALAAGQNYGHLDEFSPPFANNSVPVVSIPMCAFGLGFDSIGNLYVRGCDGIDVYEPPFGVSMKKAYVISSAGYPGFSSIVFDDAGNMYATGGSTTGNDLLMYTPPFSSASQPAVTLPGPFFDVKVGP